MEKEEEEEEEAEEQEEGTHIRKSSEFDEPSMRPLEEEATK